MIFRLFLKVAFLLACLGLVVWSGASGLLFHLIYVLRVIVFDMLKYVTDAAMGFALLFGVIFVGIWAWEWLAKEFNTSN